MHSVDVADIVKLVLLAVFVPVVTVAARRAGMVPRWMSGVAIALVVLLPLGGASFVVANGLLGMLLVVSLPGPAGVGRDRRPAGGAARALTPLRRPDAGGRGITPRPSTCAVGVAASIDPGLVEEKE